MVHLNEDQWKDLLNDAYAMVFCFLYKSICYGYSFELHQQVDAIQMGTHNICLYQEVPVDKKYTGCNLNPRPAEPGYTLPLQTV